jgi:hypothetical protein
VPPGLNDFFCVPEFCVPEFCVPEFSVSDTALVAPQWEYHSIV